MYWGLLIWPIYTSQSTVNHLIRSLVTSLSSLRQLFTFFCPLLCVVIISLAFLRLTCVKTYLICPHKEYLDLKNKLSELRNRERFLLERRTATYSTSSAEPSPPCTTPSSSGATSPIPSSRSSFAGSDHPFSPPLRAHIRVHLPNHQYTVVSIGQYICIDFWRFWLCQHMQ